MLDTMTFTKILGSFCGALLVFLLGKWVAETLYHTGGGGHGKEHAAAYVIDTGADDAAAEEVEEVDFATLLASADADEGAQVFCKCRACHKLEDGANGTGPHLYRVVDCAIQGVDGFGYSGALIEAGDAWTADNLNAFLENPKGWAPGTSMGFAGLKKPEDRANLIAYLSTIGG